MVGRGKRRSLNLSAARPRLSELVERAAAGEAVLIMRRGKPIARITAIGSSREPIDLVALRALTDAMPIQPTPSRAFIRRMRDVDPSSRVDPPCLTP
jgi:prevent-host-death family protein